MIRVNTAEIGPDGLPLVGEEKPDFLELDTTEGIPVKVLENVKYNFHASMAGQDLLVTGSAFTRIRTECSKCLKEIEIRIGSDKICIFKEKVPDEIIDLTDDVREDILLSADPVQMFRKLPRSLPRLRRGSQYGTLPLPKAETEKSSAGRPYLGCAG